MSERRKDHAMHRILLEACCGSARDVRLADIAGADRMELNTALALGGLTPSAGELEQARAATCRPILVMVRPREGDFRYDPDALATMAADIRILGRTGADGFVFGCLTEDACVDTEAMRRLLDTADGKPCVFHRALDLVPDWKRALDTLMALGVTRVLTSGQKPSAWEGRHTLQAMHRYAGDQLEILPGGGIRPGLGHALVTETGCTQLHLSGRRQIVPARAANPDGIALGTPGQAEDGQYGELDPDVFIRLRQELEAETI